MEFHYILSEERREGRAEGLAEGLEKGLAKGEQERQTLQDEIAQLKAENAMLRAGHVSDVQSEYKP